MAPPDNKYNDKLNSCQFIHANGFPPDAYNTLLSSLKNKLKIDSVLLRPLWKTPGTINNVKNWDIFLNDFLSHCKENSISDSIGLGHSIGGNIIVRAAISNNNLFKAIILLDPTIFHPTAIPIAKALNFLDIFKYIHPYALATKKRRASYSSYEEILESYRNKNIFSKINTVQLEEYINSIFKYEEGEYKLSYSKKWEEIIYLKAALKDYHIWRNLESISIPTLIIKPDNNPVLRKKASNKLSKNKFIDIKTLENSTHLFPLEYPKKVYDLIAEFLLKNNI